MIANGGSYRCAWWWAKHLQSKENDRATVVKSDGLRSENIYDMLLEMEAHAQATRCENFFYQMNLNPRGDERLTEEQWERAREIAEKHHGLEGQAYFTVEHVKDGRVHRHLIWSRIDLENMRAISDSNDARKNHAIAREIERELGLERVIGPYDREPGMPRPKRAPEPWEMYRGMKTGLDPRDIAAEVTELFHQSDSGKAFQAALEEHGYLLLKGDRRGFLILDTAGKEHSLARRLEGINTKELNAFMRDVDRAGLPSVEVAKERFQEHKIEALEADRATVKHEIEWEVKLSQAAIEKEARERNLIPREEITKGETGGREKISEIDISVPVDLEVDLGAGAFTLGRAGSQFAEAAFDAVGSGLAQAEKLAGAIFDLIDPPTKPLQRETERSATQEKLIVPAAQPRLLDFSSYTRQPEQEATRERGERER